MEKKNYEHASQTAQMVGRGVRTTCVVPPDIHVRTQDESVVECDVVCECECVFEEGFVVWVIFVRGGDFFFPLASRQTDIMNSPRVFIATASLFVD